MWSAAWPRRVCNSLVYECIIHSLLSFSAASLLTELTVTCNSSGDLDELRRGIGPSSGLRLYKIQIFFDYDDAYLAWADEDSFVNDMMFFALSVADDANRMEGEVLVTRVVFYSEAQVDFPEGDNLDELRSRCEELSIVWSLHVGLMNQLGRGMKARLVLHDRDIDEDDPEFDYDM